MAVKVPGGPFSSLLGTPRRSVRRSAVAKNATGLAVTDMFSSYCQSKCKSPSRRLELCYFFCFWEKSKYQERGDWRRESAHDGRNRPRAPDRPYLPLAAPPAEKTEEEEEICPCCWLLLKPYLPVPQSPRLLH